MKHLCDLRAINSSCIPAQRRLNFPGRNLVADRTRTTVHTMLACVVLPAKPDDFQRLGVIPMVALAVWITADFTRLADKLVYSQCFAVDAIRACLL